MKTQIKRLSSHQNGKVFGVICALGSLVFVVPMMFFAGAMESQGMGMPRAVFLLFPVGYLVMGYLSVALACIVYNFAFGFLGGIEYEAVEVDD